MIDVLWLADIFEGVEGLIEVRCFIDDETPSSKPFARFCGSLDDAEIELTDRDNIDHWNVYVGMATRCVKRGRKEDLHSCRVFWIDYDHDKCRGDTWQEKAREGVVDFEDRAARFPLPPSIVVDSGGGRHAYWILNEPFDLRTPEMRERFECILKGLQCWWESDNKVVDSARILRVPGTRNWPDSKKRAKGRTQAESRVVTREGHRYHADDFVMFEERGISERSLRMAPGLSATAGLAVEIPERIRSVFEIDPKSKALFMHDASALPKHRSDPSDTSASVFDMHLAIALIAHPTLTREEIIETAKAARRQAGDGNTEKINRVAYWDRTLSAALEWSRRSRGEEQPPDVGDWPARLRWMLRSKRAKTITAQALDMVATTSPRFPIGLPHFDHGPSEGAYGFTSVSGSEGVGKSLLMLTAGMSAATLQHEPWTVVYFDGENAPNIVNQRIQRWWNLPVDEIRSRLVNFHRFWVSNESASLSALREFSCSCIAKDTKRVLIIIDSINTICDKMAKGQGAHYFTLMRDVLMWLQDARVESSGDIACIVTSELNQKKNMKGEKIAYTIDCGFRITEKKRSVAYEIDMHKSRDTKRPEKALFRIDQKHARFIPVGALEDASEGKRIALDGGKVISMDDKRKDREQWWNL